MIDVANFLLSDATLICLLYNFYLHADVASIIGVEETTQLQQIIIVILYVHAFENLKPRPPKRTKPHLRVGLSKHVLDLAKYIRLTAQIRARSEYLNMCWGLTGLEQHSRQPFGPGYNSVIVLLTGRPDKRVGSGWIQVNRNSIRFKYARLILNPNFIQIGPDPTGILFGLSRVDLSMIKMSKF